MYESKLLTACIQLLSESIFDKIKVWYGVLIHPIAADPAHQAGLNIHSAWGGYSRFWKEYEHKLDSLDTETRYGRVNLCLCLCLYPPTPVQQMRDSVWNGGVQSSLLRPPSKDSATYFYPWVSLRVCHDAHMHATHLPQPEICNRHADEGLACWECTQVNTVMIGH